MSQGSSLFRYWFNKHQSISRASFKFQEEQFSAQVPGETGYAPAGIRTPARPDLLSSRQERRPLSHHGIWRPTCATRVCSFLQLSVDLL